MKAWLVGAGLGLLVLCLPAPARAAGLPVGLLSKSRVGPRCMDSSDTNAALDCWLNAHPDVANAMAYQEANFSGAWPVWPAAAKNRLHKSFNLMVLFYKIGMPPNFPQPLAMPLSLHGPPVFTFDGTHLSEADGQTEYFLLVGNNLAAELTAAFPWSIATYTFSQDLMLLSMGDALGNWNGAPQNVAPGYYFTGIGHAVPAPPAYTLTFITHNQILGPSAGETIANLFMWERIFTHYYLDAGVNPSDMPTLFWGPDATPIAESQLIHGTTYTGPSGPTFGHFTMGCHGTQDFMKVVLQAVNIPTRIWGTANHATPYFPTVDLAMTHGDDPYDQIGIVTPVPGFPQPKPIQYLVSITALNNLCDPSWPDPGWCEHKVGLAPALIGIVFGSDYLMNMHCQDLAAGATHATSSVLSFLKWYWPEKTIGDVQTVLENAGMWTTLDAKVAATNYCQ